MRLVAFSDWHVCHSWPLITLDDIEAVHVRLVAYVQEHRPDLVLFLGDRFRAREPKDRVRAVADVGLRQLAAAQAAHGGIIGLLVGNHDRYSESVGAGNTYSAMRVWGDVMPNAWLMERPGTYIPRPDVAIHALPASFPYVAEQYAPLPEAFNIFVFHGLIAGATYDRAGNVPIKHGVKMADLDNPAWDLVLGGDVHVGQRFNLHHTTGGYVGSTLRLTEGDGHQPRGWLDVVLQKGAAPAFTFVDGGGPRFTQLAGGVDLTGWDGRAYTNEIVVMTLRGTASELRAVEDVDVKDWFAARGARAVLVRRQAASETLSLVDGIAATSTPFDDMAAYIGSTDRKGLDPDRLLAKAAEILHGASLARKGLFA